MFYCFSTYNFTFIPLGYREKFDIRVHDFSILMMFSFLKRSEYKQRKVIRNAKKVPKKIAPKI